MSKDLSTLIRLHKYRVDEKRRSLGELLGIIAKLEEKSENLEAEIILEQQMASSAPESIGMFYGAYAKEVVNKRKEILDEIFDCEKKIAEKKEELRTEYKDLKIFEITQEAREKVVASEVTKTEQIILDEMGQESYRRRN